ncbi:MAG: hypothetical protein P8Y97_21620 [Candidatus Lokiarchaeota archaeon]
MCVRSIRAEYGNVNRGDENIGIFRIIYLAYRSQQRECMPLARRVWVRSQCDIDCGASCLLSLLGKKRKI